ncbi:MAG TPA: metallophosphoesterase family protein [Solirubrobacterales bacterium]|nr:metallophosphoesterase family protein [Solirubrobacterales bacterium]
MRVAVLSDIHSNRQALEAVLAAIDATDVEEIWCLGDVVGYGADPDACTALVRERAAVCLAGNHDLAVLGSIDISTFSETAAAAAVWTREQAGEPTLSYLRELEPAGARAGVGLFHASPSNPVWEYVLSLEQADDALDDQEQRIGLIGHSHVALFFTRPERSRPGDLHGAQAGAGAQLDLADGVWLINPGSVGQPRDGDPRAAWLELDTDEWTGRFHRVGYDVDGAAAAILAAGLPTALADRLRVGR